MTLEAEVVAKVIFAVIAGMGAMGLAVRVLWGVVKKLFEDKIADCQRTIEGLREENLLQKEEIHQLAGKVDEYADRLKVKDEEYVRLFGEYRDTQQKTLDTYLKLIEGRYADREGL